MLTGGALLFFILKTSPQRSWRVCLGDSPGRQRKNSLTTGRHTSESYRASALSLSNFEEKESNYEKKPDSFAPTSLRTAFHPDFNAGTAAYTNACGHAPAHGHAAADTEHPAAFAAP